jgi:N-acetylmuramoyl-L-alanine amidase
VSRHVNLIVIHQSASNNPAHDNVETIEKWHRERGFKKIGYHYFISKNGTVFNGRKEDEVGAHTKGHNSYSIGICLSGEGEKTATQLNALEILLIDVCSRYGLEKASIVGHKDLANTECPGFDLKSWLKSRDWS